MLSAYLIMVNVLYFDDNREPCLIGANGINICYPDDIEGIVVRTEQMLMDRANEDGHEIIKVYTRAIELNNSTVQSIKRL